MIELAGPLTRHLSAGMRNRITRGERLLDEITKAGIVTESGRAWLRTACDPCCDDIPESLDGWPDLESAPSVTRCIKQTTSFSSPYASGTWDANFVLWPFLNSMAFDQASRSGNTLTPTGNAALYFSAGGLCAYCTNTTGSDLTITGGPSLQMTLPDTYSKGSSRVVGLGFEIVNTTSDLYRQGQVTVWRQPNTNSNASKFSGCVYNSAGTALTMNAEFAPIPCPPLNNATATLIPGSKTWHAEKGNYSVCPFVGLDNPPALVNYVQPMLWAAPNDDTTFNIPLAFPAVPTTSANTQAVGIPVWATSAIAGGARARPVKTYPIHMPGAYYQGLSHETTLSVTLVVYVETFPTVSENDILVLAKPSAELDTVALQIASHVFKVLPIAVWADENVFGDWFTKVISGVSDFLVAPLGAIHPALGAAAVATGGLARAWRARQGYDSFATPPSPGMPSRKSKPLPPIPSEKKMKRDIRAAVAEGIAVHDAKKAPKPPPKPNRK